MKHYDEMGLQVSSSSSNIALSRSFPMVPFDPPKNIRKTLVFRCFQEGQKGKIGIKNIGKKWINVLCFLACSSYHSLYILKLFLVSVICNERCNCNTKCCNFWAKNMYIIILIFCIRFRSCREEMFCITAILENSQDLQERFIDWS